jgi:D-aminopeptidase
MVDVVLLDSISAVGPAHAGCIVVTGSHGGAAAVGFVLPHAIAGLVFNDAGGGKDRAGLSALDLLAARGIPAVAVAHTSARIGEAEETLRSGIVSAVNGIAAARGVALGMTARAAVDRLQEVG